MDQPPRLTARLMATLAAHPYRTHVRELSALLWGAIGDGDRQEIAWRDLGLSSRHVLSRLVRKFDLKVRGRGGS